MGVLNEKRCKKENINKCVIFFAMGNEKNKGIKQLKRQTNKHKQTNNPTCQMILQMVASLCSPRSFTAQVASLTFMLGFMLWSLLVFKCFKINPFNLLQI